MRYEHIVRGIFKSRPNRFIAHVEVNGKQVVCHVKNTGRCRELLIPGVPVFLEFHPEAGKMGRKTEYDLIGVMMGDILVKMDSQAPNKVAWEWMQGMAQMENGQKRREYLPGLQPDRHAESDRSGEMLFREPGNDPILWLPRNIRREVTHGDSRFDLAFTLENRTEASLKRPAFMEVKGVTLEQNGQALFPDAPTERGVKHLKGLAKACQEGYEAYVLFVIQMKGVSSFRPNDATHPAFGGALREAAAAGVHVLAYDCAATADSLTIDTPVTVTL